MKSAARRTESLYALALALRGRDERRNRRAPTIRCSRLPTPRCRPHGGLAGAEVRRPISGAAEPVPAADRWTGAVLGCGQRVGALGIRPGQHLDQGALARAQLDAVQWQAQSGRGPRPGSQCVFPLGKRTNLDTEPGRVAPRRPARQLKRRPGPAAQGRRERARTPPQRVRTAPLQGLRPPGWPPWPRVPPSRGRQSRSPRRCASRRLGSRTTATDSRADRGGGRGGGGGGGAMIIRHRAVREA